MVGRVGYAPTTSAMSMQHSTIELTAIKNNQIQPFEKIFVFLLHANITEKLIQNKVILKSLKKEPLGNSGIKFIKTKVKAPICKQFLDSKIDLKILNIKQKKILNIMINPNNPCSESSSKYNW